MSYRLNLPGMFAVPDCLVDEHLKLARELPLKVLLWMLRHKGSEGIEALAHRLGKPEDEIIDAVQYWIGKGIISLDNDQPAIGNEQNFQPAAPQAAPAMVVALPPVRPTAAQLLARTAEDATLRELFRMADTLLGRTIGYEGQCVLLTLHDTYGLPADVICMLLHYCADTGKTNNGYIEAVGRDWGNRGIDTLEKADAQIAALKENLSLWNELRRRAGIQTPKPTAPQSEYLRRWSREFGYGIDMIFAAYEEMAERTGKLSFSYMSKILEGWHAAGLKTPEEAAAAKAQHQKKLGKGTAKRRSSATGGGAPAPVGFAPSFDLEAFERSTLQVPAYED